MDTVFLLSPARCTGKRASYLMNGSATFPAAAALQSPEGATIGEVFSFVSGLYFRGKLAYAGAFARPPGAIPGILVITPNRGLMPSDQRITMDDFRKFVTVDIHPADARFRKPLEADARRIADEAGTDCRVVLLGSVATGKYVEILAPVFGRRLLFPSEFVGRGDMSRGGLLLRQVLDGRELNYIPVDGAVRHGPKPPKLVPLRKTRATV